MAYRKAMVLCSALPGDQSRLLSALSGRVPRIDGLNAALAAAPPVELIHAFNLSWESPLMAAAVLAGDRQVPLVITPFAHFGVGSGESTDRDRVARNSTMDHQLRVMQEAAAILVLTESERRGLAAYGVPVAKIDVIGGGCDPLPEDWAAALSAPQMVSLPPRFVLFVGRAGRDKGTIDAGEAVLELRRQGRDIALVVAGIMSPDFAHWLALLPAAEQAAVVSLGTVSEQMKHALLSRAEMLVLPSRSDSFGIVFLEAWQHGRPVIGARAGGIPGVVDDGRNGLLVDYGDRQQLAVAIARILDNPDWAVALGADGLRKVTTNLTWEQTAARVATAYSRVLEQA